jgi:hypothetical protein
MKIHLFYHHLIEAMIKCTHQTPKTNERALLSPPLFYLPVKSSKNYGQGQKHPKQTLQRLPQRFLTIEEEQKTQKLRRYQARS